MINNIIIIIMNLLVIMVMTYDGLVDDVLDSFNSSTRHLYGNNNYNVQNYNSYAEQKTFLFVFLSLYFYFSSFFLLCMCEERLSSDCLYPPTDVSRFRGTMSESCCRLGKRLYLALETGFYISISPLNVIFLGG